MSYSQRDEEETILKYFQGQQGTFLDIGAYHPEVFSNTRGLFEIGWNGVCVEPSPSCVGVLRDSYKDTSVEVFQVLIGQEDKTRNDFFDSNGDALSSTDQAHIEKWAKGYGSKFTPVEVQQWTIETLINNSKYKTFDFIDIDAEGMDFEILKQIDLTKVKMVCIEKGDDKVMMEAYLSEHMRFIKEFAENLIYAV